MAKKTPTKSVRKSPTRKKKKSKPSLFKRLLGACFKWGVIFSLIASIPFSIWVWYLNTQVVSRFEGQKWQVPSEVYSAPVVLKSGSPWKKQDLEQLLEETGYRFGRNSQKVGWAARSQTQISAYLRPYVDHLGSHQAERRLFSFNNGRLIINTINGTQVNEAKIEPQRIGFLYGGTTVNRQILKHGDIPETLLTILTSVEDQDFYDHWGISLAGIARAAFVNVTQGSRRQGGSTLTQQLVKNMFLSSERTYTRKLTEVVMSVLLEHHYSKESIITAYVNEVYLAQIGSTALHGFAAASEHFFGRPINELNIEEFALLVGMVKGPSSYNPRRSPKRAKSRRDTVLGVLKEQGRLSSNDHDRLVKQPIRVVNKQKERNVYGDYLDLVSIQLSRDFDKAHLASENLKIYTGVDIRAQRAANSAMQNQVNILEKRDPKLKGLQGAMVVTDRESGQVRAVVGSSSKYYTGFNRALGAIRPIGSLVKPPLYLSALATGRYTWWSKIEDKRLHFRVGGRDWIPENYDRKEHGVVHLFEALAKSYNLATLNLVQDIGFDRVGETLRELGVKRPFTMRPAVALGSLELSPFEVSRLYQPIVSQGKSSELGVVLAVMNQDNQLLKRFNQDTSVPYTNAVLAVTLDGMTKAPQIGTAKAAQSVFPNLNFAAKTGTTNQQKDSWFIGITGDYSSTVWLGDDDNVPLSITGSSGAQKVWIDFTRRVNPTSLPNLLPKGAVRLNVLEDEFEVASDRCDEKVSLAFIKGTEPKSSSSCLWPF